MEIIQHQPDQVVENKFRLMLNGVSVCDLSFDQWGKLAIGLTNIDDVHRFCRVTLAVIDDLPTGESMIEGLPRALR
jgi:hypothetical protein